MNGPIIRAKFFIGGLSPLTHAGTLCDYFHPFAEIDDVTLKQGRGFAFVTFIVHSPQESVDLTANLINATHFIDGNAVSVRVAIPRAQLFPHAFISCPRCGHNFPATN